MRMNYQDGSSMDEHLNAFQGLINQIVILEILIEDEVLALLLLGSLLDSWETLVVTLDNLAPQMKQLTWNMLSRVFLKKKHEGKRKSPNLSIRCSHRK